MTTATFDIPGRGMRADERVRSFLLVTLVYLVAWGVTEANFMGDTNPYTEAILQHENERVSVGFRLTPNPFWDFGHLFWRPLGWLGWRVSKPVTRRLNGYNERAEVLWTLIGMNFLAALLCVILFFGLARRIIGRTWPAAGAALGFCFSGAFLNYSHSGTPYVVGLTCLVAGMWLSFQVRQGSPGKTVVLASLAGCMFALAALFWLPYIFVLPAAIAAPLFMDKTDFRWRLAGHTTVVCVVIGCFAYGSAAAIAGIRDSAGLKDWILSSSHGQIQPGGFRLAANLAFSLPRSFVNMNRDGMWLKRYLIRDPYAPVSAADLLRLSLWKLLLVYGAAAIVSVELLGSKRGRSWALVTACAALPCLGFAALFAAGSIERYLVLYPFVFLACGFALTEHARRSSKLLLIFALAVMTLVNIDALRRGTLERERSAAVSRIYDLVPSLRPGSVAIAVNAQDNLARFQHDFPLDAINLESRLEDYVLLEINAERLGRWQEDFAKRALASFERGSCVWLPERLFQSKPRPEWNWVEGDDKRVKWADLPLFFSRFETGSPVGGADGFVPMLPSAHNVSLLMALVQSRAP